MSTQTVSTHVLPPRLTEPGFSLVLRALGSPADAARKLARLLEGAAAFLDLRELDRRLAILHRKGVIDVIPSWPQIVLGGLDMVRSWIMPAASDYYRQRGIHGGFHQLLRFLEDPRALMNPVGLLNSQDAINGHLMQVVHADPDYDLQLLEMFDDGLDRLEQELCAVLDGSHPRADSLRAVVEEPDYHARLLDYLRAWRRGEVRGGLRRHNVAQREDLSRLAQTFGDLTHAMRYFATLPSRPLDFLKVGLGGTLPLVF